MTTYFAFKLADSTQQGIDELLANLAAGTKEPQHPLHTRVSVEIVDEILKNAVEELVGLFQEGTEGAGILHTLLSLIKSTAHVLVRQMLGKHDNAEVAKMASYLSKRRVVLADEIRYGFALPADLANGFRNFFAAVDNGQGKENRDALKMVLQQFADLALVGFYDDFTEPMSLGFIKRKAADLGRSTIHKGLSAAINKLVPQLGQKDLALFTQYYRTLIVDV